MSKTFVTADTHFGHKNILKYDNAPFKSIEERDNTIIMNWNSIVAAGDTVWHLGDFALSGNGYAQRVMDALNGTIHLVVGNHERTVLNTPPLRARFQSISSYKEVWLNKQMFVLCHYPIHEWNRGHRGSMHLHGHTHRRDTYASGLRRLNVGIMNHGYKPLNMEGVKSKLERFPFIEHH